MADPTLKRPLGPATDLRPVKNVVPCGTHFSRSGWRLSTTKMLNHYSTMGCNDQLVAVLNRHSFDKKIIIPIAKSCARGVQISFFLNCSTQINFQDYC